MLEIWKDISDYECKYQVSNYGNVRSLNYKQTGKVKLLKPHRSKRGYMVVYLLKNSERKVKKIHRLVAEAFIDNLENKPQVNHIDGNKENNVVNNLEWVTPLENMNHAHEVRLITRPFGSENKMSRKIIGLNTGDIFRGVREASRYFGIDGSSISKCCKGKLSRAGTIKDKPAKWMYYHDYLEITGCGNTYQNR